MKNQNNRYKYSLGGMIAFLAGIAAVHADPIPVDAGYSATPSTNPAAYGDTGGIELTDGNVGSLVWPSAPADTPPLVGWENIDGTVTFNFSSTVTIGEIVSWFADSNGSAGVGVPESIRVTTTGGFDQTFPVTDPAGGGTTAPISISGLSLETDNVTLFIARNTGANPDACCAGYSWTMLSEVQFFTPPDPNGPSLIAPSEVDLGTVNTDPLQTMGSLDISNIDTAASNLIITDVSIQGGDVSNFLIDSFPASLAPDETGQITFTFNSGGIPGSYSSSIVITNNGDSSPVIIPITADVIQPLTPSTPYQQAVVAHNPLLYWTFDEAGDFDVASSLVNNTTDNLLIPQGGASRTASTTTAGGVSLGRAASFDGIAGTMFSASDLFGDPTPGANNDPGFDFIASQLWAVEFWFNVSNAPNQYFSEAFDSGGTANNPALIYNFNSEQLELFGGGGRTGPTSVTAGTWHHAVAAFYGNSGGFADNLREFYVDGVLFQSTTDLFSAGHGLRNIAIGNATNGTVPVNGAIDEYAIYELGGLADLAARQAHVADIAGHFALSTEAFVFRVTEIARIPGNKIRMTWNSKTTGSYSIFYSTDLTEFTDNVDDSIDSQGTSTTFEFDNPSVDFDNPQGSPNLYFIVSENE